jgi:rubrerythrin
VAEQEGFMDVAAAFRAISRVEVQHEKRYRKLLENVERGRVFKKDSPSAWKCRNCGHVHEGPEAPETCPACLHPKNFFELHTENY